MENADKEDALVVVWVAMDSVFLGTTKVAPEELTQKLKDRLEARTNKEVFVKADARAKYKFVVDVVDNVRSAQVDQLGLITEERKKKVPGHS